MHAPQRQSRSLAWLIITVLAAGLTFALKLVIALTTIGTNDVLRWETFLANAQAHGGIGLYHKIGYFNHPPFMTHVLHALDYLTSLTGLAFPFWLRLPAILADLGSIVLVWKLLGLRLQAPGRPVALVLMALAPPSLMISGFHGNTDPVMMFFVLLSIYVVDKGQRAWLAGALLGISMNIKVVPLIFMPAIYLYLPNTRKRIEFFAATAAVFVVGSLPYLVQDPAFIVERIFGYGSSYGHWGLSRVFTLLGSVEQVKLFNAAYAQWGKFIVLATIVAMAFWMNQSLKKPPLFFQCGVVAFLFMALTPGFGVQYLAWLVPWVVGVGGWAALIYYTASGSFLFLVYHFWAREFPWRLANADVVGVWRGYLVYFEFFCWASVVVVLVLFLKGLLRNPVRDVEGPGSTQEAL